MLRTETVERATFELLKTLMQDEKLKDFNLVGGTALALYMGHRKSIDLDLFSTQAFDTGMLEKYFQDRYDFKVKNPEKKSDATISLQEMLEAFQIKFPKTNKMTAVKGIGYFDAIEFDVTIELTKGAFTWKPVEKRINEMIKYPDKIFSPMEFCVEELKTTKKKPSEKLGSMQKTTRTAGEKFIKTKGISR
ncbi:MAG: nucleotidyl transferase AbiEii/AbiGii toxin family protein [Bacteroidales bacterium]|jgi:hypothetical protein|nr:nucleotidyl transferase AbiEii/AbiGii toxin family protein [Bacteroidales bacterium]